MLPDPPHIKVAKSQLAQLGLPVAAFPHLVAALDLAAVAYHELPQSSRAYDMKRQRDIVQDELESVSSQLLHERNRSKNLQEENARLREAKSEKKSETAKAPRPKAPQDVADLLSVNGSLKAQVALLQNQLHEAKGEARVGGHVLSVTTLLRSLRKIGKHAPPEEYAAKKVANIIANAECILAGQEPSNEGTHLTEHTNHDSN